MDNPLSARRLAGLENEQPRLNASDIQDIWDEAFVLWFRGHPGRLKGNQAIALKRMVGQLIHENAEKVESVLEQ